MDRFISSQDKLCRLAFDRALEACKVAQLSDDFDRYKIWAANVGAPHSGTAYQKSLDYRLREAPAYKEQVLAILDQLEQSLVQAGRYAAGEVLAGDSSSSGEESDSEDDEVADEGGVDGGWTLSEDGDDGAALQSMPLNIKSGKDRQTQSTGLKWFLDHDDRTGLPPALDSISFAVTCLYRIPVRETATYTRLNRYRKAKSKEFELYAHFDMLFVRDLFPTANSAVVTRLGKFVTERRRLLRYRQLHNEELQRASSESKEAKSAVKEELLPTVSEGQFPQEADNVTERAQSSMPKSSIKASTMRPKVEMPVDPSQMLFIQDTEADEVTSIATTLVSRDLLHIPDRPKDGKGGEREDFVCPYCLILRHIHSPSAWKRHVLNDLEPYVCTHADCAEPDRMYSNKADWFLHESQHLSAFFCGDRSHDRFIDPVDFMVHMQSAHEIRIVPDGSLDTFRHHTDHKGGICHLCGAETSNLKHHVSRHLQRVALFALPRNSDDDEIREGSGASKDNQQGSRDSREEPLDRETGSTSNASTTESQSHAAANNLVAVPDSATEVNWGDVKPELQDFRGMDTTLKDLEEEFCPPLSPEEFQSAVSMFNFPVDYNLVLAELSDRKIAKMRGATPPAPLTPTAMPEQLIRKPSDPLIDNPSPVAELPAAMAVFQEAESSGSGTLSMDELSNAIQRGDWELFDGVAIQWLVSKLSVHPVSLGDESRISFEQFEKIWQFLCSWRDIFEKYDEDATRHLTPMQFSRAISAFGYRLSESFLSLLYRTYTRKAMAEDHVIGQRRVIQMRLDQFIRACTALKQMTDVFKEYDQDRDGYATLSFEEFCADVHKLQPLNVPADEDPEEVTESTAHLATIQLDAEISSPTFATY